MPPAWRIYYADGSVYDDSDGDWNSAPQEGVIVIVRKTEHGFSFSGAGADMYRMEDGEIILGGYDEIGTWLRMLRPDIKFGFGISRPKFDKIVARAHKEFA